MGLITLPVSFCCTPERKYMEKRMLNNELYWPTFYIKGIIRDFGGKYAYLLSCLEHIDIAEIGLLNTKLELGGISLA